MLSFKTKKNDNEIFLNKDAPGESEMLLCRDPLMISISRVLKYQHQEYFFLDIAHLITHNKHSCHTKALRDGSLSSRQQCEDS